MKPSPCGRMLVQPTPNGWEVTITDLDLNATMRGTVPTIQDPACTWYVPLYPAPPGNAGPRPRRRRGRARRALDWLSDLGRAGYYLARTWPW